MADSLNMASNAAKMLGAEEKEADVPVEHLDYDYVGKSTDWRYLKVILRVLKSGKEGRYFDLEDFTEQRMLEVMPDKERQKWVALHTEPSYDDIDAAKADLADWLGDVNQNDQELQEFAGNNAGTSGIFDKAGLPPVRQTPNATTAKMSITGSGTANAAGVEERKGGESKRQQPQLLGSARGSARKKEDPRKRSFKEYYDNWDKFDVDAVEAQMDAEEKAKSDASAAAAEKQRAEIEARTAARRADLGKLRLKVDPNSLPKASRTHHAVREKQKGNEYFRSQEFEDAVLYYSRSLEFDPASAVVLSNRAQAYLQLKEWEKAEADALRAVNVDPKYVKAWVRLGNAYKSRGKYLDAVRALERAEKINPDNASVQRLLREVKQKFIDVEGDDAKYVLAGKTPPKRAPAKAKKVKQKKKPRKVEEVKDRHGNTSMLIEELSGSDSESDDDVEDVPAAAAAPSRGTRVQIVADSDSDSDSDSEEPQPARSTGTRVAIAVDDDDDDSSDSEDDLPAPPNAVSRPAAAKPASTRVQIAEDSGSDSDSDSDGDLPAPANAVKRPATTASAPAAAAAAAPEAPRKSTRVAIAGDSDSDDSDSEDDLPAPSNAVKRPAAAVQPPPVPEAAQPAPAVDAKAEAERLRKEGNGLFTSGKLLKAAAAYAECVQLDPLNFAAFSNRALVYLKLGRPRESVADCDAALAAWRSTQAPGTALSGVPLKALYRRGLAYKALGQWMDAKADFEALIQVEPKNPKPVAELKVVKAQLAAAAAEHRKAPAAAVAKASPAKKAASMTKKPSVSSPAVASAGGAGVGVGAGSAPASPASPAPSSPSSTAPSPPSSAARKAMEVAERARKLIYATGEVPAAPKTGREFEKQCLALRKRPEVFGEYLQQIKPKSLRKLLKRGIDTTTIGAIAGVGGPVLLGANNGFKAGLSLLLQLPKVEGFRMANMMVKKVDREALAVALRAAQNSGADATKVQSVAKSFKVAL